LLESCPGSKRFMKSKRFEENPAKGFEEGSKAFGGRVGG
jgi:hypothetical protein